MRSGPGTVIIEVRYLSRKSGRMSRWNPGRDPPARGRRAGRGPGGGRALFTAGRGTTMSFRSRAALRQGPGIMRGGDLCRCSRRIVFCAVL
jgi:hypothetical protein